MKREIRNCRASVVSESLTAFDGDIRGWLASRAKEHNLTWLLAHADDGVIWGVIRNTTLVTALDVVTDPAVKPFCRALRSETLQTARLFAPHAEAMLWRDGDRQWHWRLIVEEAEKAEFSECFDEPQILWGDRGRDIGGGFTLMEDGKQGLRHAVPLAQAARDFDGERPLRLGVRHYVKEDEIGFVRVVAGRLTALTLDGAK